MSRGEGKAKRRWWRRRFSLRTLAIIFPIKVGLFVRADSPIKSIKDMKGKTIAYGFTSQEIIKLTVDAMLATEGLTAADLKTVLVPNLVRGVDEFMSGRVDITTFAIGSAKVAEADEETETVITAKFDLAQIAELRNNWFVFRDRRPDLYTALTTYDGGTPGREGGRAG